MTEVATEELKAGDLLDGRFVLQGFVGSGGSATVWSGQDLATNMPVAIKLYRSAITSDPHLLTRLEREAYLLQRLSHPNIARFVFGQVEPNPLSYLVLELVPGVSLREELHLRSEAGHPPTDSVVLRLFTQLIAGLASAHALLVVHRDLKPANVMFEQRGDHVGVKLLDFGVAKVEQAKHHATTEGRLLGSYAYMSPEQCRGLSVSPASDVFALGTLLYETMSLKRAWLRHPDGRNLHFHERVPPFNLNAPTEIAHRICRGERPAPTEELQGVWPLLQRCWAQEAARRPDLEEIRLELERVLRRSEDEPMELTRASDLVALQGSQAKSRPATRFAPLGEPQAQNSRDVQWYTWLAIGLAAIAIFVLGLAFGGLG